MDASNKQKRRRGKSKSPGTKDELNALVYKPHQSPLIDLSEDSSGWYDIGLHLPGRNDTVFSIDTSSKCNTESIVRKYRSIADEVYRTEVALVSADSDGGNALSDAKWVANTMKKGTLKDRIAATSVLVSTDPVHKLSALDSLLDMVRSNDTGSPNSRVAQMAAEALEDLFLNTLLPPSRKLFPLDHRPLVFYETSTSKTLSPRVLLLWRYEEMLKERYQAFLNDYLVSTLKDGMELNKMFALRTAGSLLRSTPEGEGQLLGMMVNKLGDPGKKVTAAACHELRRTLALHENMHEVVAREVQQLAHRPHLSPRALYNCVVFLNQLKLHKETRKGDSNDAPVLAVSLVNTYFRMFDVAVKKGFDENTGMKSRLLSALLTGINRAHPYLPDKDKALKEHTDSLYNVAHTAPPSASTQALMLLFHVTVGQSGRTERNDEKEIARFYRAVYAKLASSQFFCGGKHLTMFFNLLFKAMKSDSDDGRVVAFAKRIMCTVAHLSAPVVAASLFLLSELTKTHRSIADSLNDFPSVESGQLSLDPTKRDPRSAMIHAINGQTKETDLHPSLWDVCLLANHYHPSVGKFADTIGSIEYAGDPLRDFSLAPFLDKFSYKNPKAAKKGHNCVAERKIADQTNQPVNNPYFLKQGKVDAAEKFFHRFFAERARRDALNGITRGVNDQSNEDEAFDIMEKHQVDQVFESGDPADPEEEAFVDNLALNLMQSNSQSPADLDDEDPDMDDWNNLKDDNDIEEVGFDGRSRIKEVGRDELKGLDDDSGQMFVGDEASDEDGKERSIPGEAESWSCINGKGSHGIFVDADQLGSIVQQAMRTREKEGLHDAKIQTKRKRRRQL